MNQTFFRLLSISVFLFSACTSIEVPKEAPTIVEEPHFVEEIPAPDLVYPIENFTTGISKKPFGLYSSPSNSPVQPERFTGFHTGVDVETTEEQKSQDVWIRAIADGTVKLAREADGYGGVIAIEHEIDGQAMVAVYGHIDLKSLTIKVGDTVTAGQNLAVLGDEFSSETDGERKHLHFSIRPGTEVNIRGYVQSEAELSAWVDPESLF